MNNHESDHHPMVETPRRQIVRHLVLSVLLWLTYVLYWRVVVARGVEREAALALGLLGLFVVLQVAFTQAWIAHNRALSQRHQGRRCVRRPAGAAAEEDFMGRKILVMPQGTDLTTVPVIVVRVNGVEKRFEAGLPLEENVREA
ncbi:MAG: hypothetical protein DHS20C21_02090 [Gemmatimonadota bacterium]|nr:MAG: hypothetical protein DHS20C21_02090 [Gemmatimonadota bacterium]